MRRRFPLLAPRGSWLSIAVALSLALVACGGSSPTPTVQVSQPTTRFTTGPYEVTLDVASLPVPKAAPVTLQIRRKAAPVAGASVRAIYDMTMMRHGEQRVTAITDANGSASLRFGVVPMGGSYRIRLRISTPGTAPADAVVFIQLSAF